MMLIGGGLGLDQRTYWLERIVLMRMLSEATGWKICTIIFPVTWKLRRSMA